jgi:hypothetical protein
LLYHFVGFFLFLLFFHFLFALFSSLEVKDNSNDVLYDTGTLLSWNWLKMDGRIQNKIESSLWKQMWTVIMLFRICEH